MAIIELKRNEKYKIETFIGYDNNGKKIRTYETFEGKKSEAKMRDMQLKQKLRNGIIISKDKLTFEELSDKWIENHAKPKLSIKTVEEYISMLPIINDVIGKYKINQITPLILENFYNKLRMRENKKQLSENTILHYYVLIGAIFNKAIKWRIIDINPNKSVDRPQMIKKQARYYDIEQIKDLLKIVNKLPLKYQALIRLALDSGARVGEILGLEWDDINFKKHTINITKTIIATKNGIKEKDKPKNNSSIRNIPITNETIKVLKKFKESQDNLKSSLGNEWLGCKKAFTSDTGGYMHPSTPNHILQKIIKNNNLPQTICFHSLRHSSASMQIALRIPSKVTSTRLGHASVTTTDAIYSHVSAFLEEEVVNKTNEVFKI